MTTEYKRPIYPEQEERQFIKKVIVTILVVFTTRHWILKPLGRLDNSQLWKHRISSSEWTHVPDNASKNDLIFCWTNRCNRRSECNRGRTICIGVLQKWRSLRGLSYTGMYLSESRRRRDRPPRSTPNHWNLRNTPSKKHTAMYTRTSRITNKKTKAYLPTCIRKSNKQGGCMLTNKIGRPLPHVTREPGHAMLIKTRLTEHKSDSSSEEECLDQSYVTDREDTGPRPKSYHSTHIWLDTHI